MSSSKSIKQFTQMLLLFSGYTNQIAECYDKMKYPLTERYPCPCTHYTPAPLDNWSDCMLESKVADDITATIKPKDYVIKVPSKEDYCGIGRRIQIIVCQGNNNNNASAAICGQKGEWLPSVGKRSVSPSWSFSAWDWVWDIGRAFERMDTVDN